MVLKFVSLLVLAFFLYVDAKPSGNSTPQKQGVQSVQGVHGVQVPAGTVNCIVYNNAKPELASHSQGVEILALLKTLTRKNVLDDKKANCTDGWVSHENSCFLIIDIPTLKWSDAQRTCQKLGGDLAKISSADENNFISDLMFKQQTVTLWGVWIGLHRKADKMFYWTDGTPLGSYKPWGSGQPDNPNSEGCANIFGTGIHRGKWNDLKCNVDPSHLKDAPVILCQKSSK